MSPVPIDVQDLAPLVEQLREEGTLSEREARTAAKVLRLVGIRHDQNAAAERVKAWVYGLRWQPAAEQTTGPPGHVFSDLGGTG